MLKSTTYDERLEKNWNWCQKYFERKKKDFHLDGWSFRMDHAKRILAQCNETRKEITVSYHFLRGPTCDEKKMRNAILHEIAHALVGVRNNHNDTWKKMALRIGCDGSRCGEMDIVDAKYVLECPNRCFSKTYHRRPKLQGKVCLKCKSPPLLKILK